MNEQDLVFRLRKRAEIRRQIQSRKSVREGKPDRIADILEEAAAEIERLHELVDEGLRRRLAKMNLFSEEDIADAITWARPGEKPKGASLCLHPGGKSLSDIVKEDRGDQEQNEDGSFKYWRNPVIKTVEALEPYRLRTTWANGEVLDVDIEHILRKLPALKEILKPEVFAKVHTDGFTIEWFDTEFGPDNIYALAKKQQAEREKK